MQSFSILQMGRGSALNKRFFASFLLYHKINCLEQSKDEMRVILEVDPPIFFYVFSLISYVNININKLKKMDNFT